MNSDEGIRENPEIAMRDLLRAACAAVRVSKKKPELWEAAARMERRLMDEIETLKREEAPLLVAAG